MDISSLLSTYKRMGRPTATLPATMLKILVSKKIVERWTSRCRNWDCVLNQLEVIFSEREAGWFIPVIGCPRACGGIHACGMHTAARSGTIPKQGQIHHFGFPSRNPKLFDFLPDRFTFTQNITWYRYQTFLHTNFYGCSFYYTIFNKIIDGFPHFVNLSPQFYPIFRA